MCQISSGSVYCVALGRQKKNNFCHFCISAFSGVAIWQQSEKVEQGCTTTTLPLSNASKSFLYSNAFMAKSSEQSVTFKSATNRHVFGRLGGGSGDIRGPSPTKLGMVIEHLGTLLHLRNFWGLTHSLANREH